MFGIYYTGSICYCNSILADGTSVMLVLVPCLFLACIKPLSHTLIFQCGIFWLIHISCKSIYYIPDSAGWSHMGMFVLLSFYSTTCAPAQPDTVLPLRLCPHVCVWLIWLCGYAEGQGRSHPCLNIHCGCLCSVGVQLASHRVVRVGGERGNIPCTYTPCPNNLPSSAGKEPKVGLQSLNIPASSQRGKALRSSLMCTRGTITGPWVSSEIFFGPTHLRFLSPAGLDPPNCHKSWQITGNQAYPGHQEDEKYPPLPSTGKINDLKSIADKKLSLQSWAIHGGYLL